MLLAVRVDTNSGGSGTESKELVQKTQHAMCENPLKGECSAPESAGFLRFGDPPPNTHAHAHPREHAYRPPPPPALTHMNTHPHRAAWGEVPGTHCSIMVVIPSRQPSRRVAGSCSVLLGGALMMLCVTSTEFDNTQSRFREKTITFQVVVETMTKARKPWCQPAPPLPRTRHLTHGWDRAEHHAPNHQPATSAVGRTRPREAGPRLRRPLVSSSQCPPWLSRLGLGLWAPPPAPRRAQRSLFLFWSRVADVRGKPGAPNDRGSCAVVEPPCPSEFSRFRDRTVTADNHYVSLS
jgi:hypothetical protein